jgi:hypothetical protein
MTDHKLTRRIFIPYPPPRAACHPREGVSRVPRRGRHGQMASTEWIHRQGASHGRQSRRHLPDVGRALTSRSTRMRPTAAQLSGRNSARSSRFAKSVASTIATSDGQPDPAQPVRHGRALPPVRPLAAPPPKKVRPPSVAARLTRTAGLPSCLQSPKRSLRLSREHRPSSTRADEVLAKEVSSRPVTRRFPRTSMTCPSTSSSSTSPTATWWMWPP